jgi:hypothetical protein
VLVEILKGAVDLKACWKELENSGKAAAAAKLPALVSRGRLIVPVLLGGRVWPRSCVFERRRLLLDPQRCVRISKP